jgi:exo-beta-1,3-glucanase (GH17 family)
MRTPLRHLRSRIIFGSTLLGALLLAGCQAETPKPSLAETLARFCWIAYSPTHFDPTTTPVQWPLEAEALEDFRVLHAAGFTGLVTYGSNYTVRGAPERALDLPKLAQQAGFEGLIVGIWDPKDAQELQTAEKFGQNPIVIGYSVGNEGLDERYKLKDLTAAMESVRQATGKPVTTTEQIHDYYENSPLWDISDWIFPNAHPYFSGYRDPQEAAAWTVKVFKTLRAVSQKPLVFKEVGLPTGGADGVSEARQAEYYQALRKTAVRFVVFEAFDAPWKHIGKQKPDGTFPWPDPEPHWGVFTSDRRPKAAVQGICPEQ